MKLSAKILKNLYDLRHERYLQKCHAIVNIGIASFLALLGVVATYIIEGNHKITNLTIEFVLIGSSIIFSLTYFTYKVSKRYRYDTIKKIKKLNDYANKL